MPLDPTKLEAARQRVALDQGKLAAARQRIAAPAEPPEPTGDPGARLLGQVGSGANRGLTNVVSTLAGGPVDAVNAGLSAVGLPMSDKPFMGSRFIREGMEGILPGPQEPTTTTERVVDRIGEELGANLPGLGAGLWLRGTAALANPVLRGLQKSLASTSADKLFKVENALAASSGTGAGIANEIAPDSALADLTGQLVGAFGPTAAQSLVRRLRSSYRARMHTPNPDELEREVGEMIARTLDDQPRTLREGIQVRDAIRETVPGFDPTTAQTTNAPALISMERSQMTAPGDFKNLFLSRRAESGEAIKDAFDRIPEIPRGAVSIADTQMALRRVLDERIAAARAAADETIALRGGRLSARQAGEIIRDEIARADTEFRLAANQLFDRVDRAGAVRLPFRSVADEALEQVTTRPTFQEAGDTPAVAQDILRFVDEDAVAQAQARGFDAEAYRGAVLANAEISFDDARSLRTRILKDIREERAGTNNRVRLRKLERLRSRADEMLDQLGESDEFPDAAQAYRDANAFYRDGVRRLREGAAAEVMRVVGGERYKVPEAEVAERFFQPGARGIARAEDFNAAVTTPEGRQALADAALNSLAEAATGTDGRLSAKRLARWRRNYREALGQLPKVEAETRSIERAQRALEQHQVSARSNVEEVEKSAAGLMLNADPEKAVAAVLKGNRPAQGLRQIRALVSSDREATNGLRRAVWDYIGQTAEGAERSLFTEEALLHPTKLRALMHRHGGALRALYSEQEMAQLRTVLHASEIAQRSAKPSVIGGSDTAEKLLNGPPSTVRTWLARTWGAVRPSRTRLAANIIAEWWSRTSRQLTEEQLQTFLNRALLDPEYAETLVMNARGVSPEKVTQLIRGHLANLGGEHQDELAADAADMAGTAGVLAKDQVERSLDKRLREFVPNKVKPPPEPKPPPPPKIPKPVKPADVTKDLARGKITPTDMIDLARSAQRAARK